MMVRLKRWLNDLAWPTYECEDCIGMAEHGCWCAYHEAEAPGKGPGNLRFYLREILKAIGWANR
jgi:hypothetical protein